MSRFGDRSREWRWLIDGRARSPPSGGCRSNSCDVMPSARALPPDSFDFVHERTVLSKCPKPGPLVAEMIRIVRPGGEVARQEPDYSGRVCDPPHPAWEC